MSIRASLLADLRLEAASTRRLLASVPPEHWDWRPHERSMPLGALASHLAENPSWGLATLERDLDLAAAFTDRRPFVASGREELLATFDANAASLERALAAADEASLEVPWRMLDGERVLMTLPRHTALRVTLLHHQIHHRGQLSVYLRLLDVPVPRTYGPTADMPGFG